MSEPLRRAVGYLIFALGLVGLVVLIGRSAPAERAAGRPGRTIELIEGHGVRCVLAYNAAQSMAAAGSTAISCLHKQASPHDGPFRVIGR